MLTWRIKPIGRTKTHCNIMIQRLEEGLGSREMVTHRTIHKDQLSKFMNKFRSIQKLNKRRMLKINGKTGFYYLFTSEGMK